MFDTEVCKQFIEKWWQESALPSFKKYIQIPNMSRTYDKQWNTNGLLLQAANHMKDWMQSVKIQGLTTQIIHDEGYSPLLFAQVKGDLPVTMFFYGHHDKQPPFGVWDQGLSPVKGVVRDDKLYGRGTADDGYATYSSILAIKAVQSQGIKIPRCVIIIEGDQQSGSVHMNHYLPNLVPKIGNPKIFFALDSGALDYNRLWLSASLRGNIVATLKVTTMKDGLHSGISSGIVPNCFRIAKQLLARVQDPETGQIHEAFHVDIPAQFYKQNYDLAQIKGKHAISQFPFLKGCQRVSDNPFSCLINRSWKPTLTITGTSGFPEAEGSGNVNLPSIELRFSLRVPPTLDSHKAVQKLRQLLTQNVPYGVKAQLYDIRAGFGWTAPTYDQYLSKAIQQSSKIFYNQEVLNLGVGVSIPLMNSLTTNWPQGQFIITGVLGPNSNAHGPNQSLDIPFCKKLIGCMSYIIAKTSQHYLKQN